MEVNSEKHQYAQEICQAEGVAIVRRGNRSTKIPKELEIVNFHLLLLVFPHMR